MKRLVAGRASGLAHARYESANIGDRPQSRGNEQIEHPDRPTGADCDIPSSSAASGPHSSALPLFFKAPSQCRMADPEAAVNQSQSYG